MAWELRGGRRYYYRKRRDGKRVVSEYIGAGEMAELIALIDRDEYGQMCWNHEKWRMEKEDLAKLDNQQKKLAQLTRQILRASLLLKGYHPHKGQWRKKRHE